VGDPPSRHRLVVQAESRPRGHETAPPPTGPSPPGFPAVRIAGDAHRVCGCDLPASADGRGALGPLSVTGLPGRTGFDPATSRHRSIESLALLKATWDSSRRDYLSTFLRFAAASIYNSGAPVITAPDVQANLLTDFGLRMPLSTVQVLLARLRRDGRLVAKDRVLLPNQAKLADPRFVQLREQVMAAYGELVAALRVHAREHHQAEWSVGEAEVALLGQLSQHAMVFGVGEAEPVLTPTESATSNRYVVACFVHNLSSPESASLLQGINVLAQGHMIANALYLDDLSQPGQKFRHTAVYLDTPVIIAALGYAGAVRAVPARELLDLLYSAGATLKCFRYTYDETPGFRSSDDGLKQKGPMGCGKEGRRQAGV
jgi:hypothetical protein